MVAEDKRRLLDVAAVLVVALLLLWPAFVNGEPFYMADTSSYLRGADAAIHHLTGQSSPWTAEYIRRFAAEEANRAAVANGVSARPIVLAGRSIYYGGLLYGAQWFGNFWALAVFQALLTATAIALTLKSVGRALGAQLTWQSVLVGGLLISVATPAGYFVCYLLPDIFGGLVLLAFGHLILLWRENGPLERVFWAVVLAAGMLFHAANFVLILALTGLTAVFLVYRRARVDTPGVRAIAAALLIAFAGQAIFSLAIRNMTGASPVRPPFVAARLIADGPGYEYLQNHCPERELIFCRAVGFRTRISDALLWSGNPKESIFQALPPEEQRQAASEQSKFILEVVRDRPLDVALSSLGATFRQLTAFNMESFNYTQANIAYFERKIPSPFIERARASKAYANVMPVAAVEWATVALVVLSFVGILSFNRTKPGAAGRFVMLLVGGILLNGAICGALSTPKGRYQMRLIWVLPLAAIATWRIRAEDGVLDAVDAAHSGRVPAN